MRIVESLFFIRERILAHTWLGIFDSIGESVPL